jgi:hypothetical protein
MERATVFPLLGETAQAIGGHYGPSVIEKIDQAHLNANEWALLAYALDFDPDPATPARYALRNPYASPQLFEEGLARLADREFLKETAPGEYRLADNGRRVGALIENALEHTFRQLEPLPEADLQRLIGLLGRLVDACERAPEPAEKSCLSYNRHSDTGPTGSPLRRILQYLADLNAWRDDAHLTAWRRYTISGPAWEALSFLWRGEAHTPPELAEKLGYRNVSAEEYQTALDELAGMGLVESGGAGTYQLTTEGTCLRETVEAETDRIYFRPWDCLSPAETAEVGHLLARLRDRLNETRVPA